MNTLLQYVIEIDESSFDVKVSFKDPFFSRLAKLNQRQTFPKNLGNQLEYQVHQYSVLFRFKDKKKGKMDLKVKEIELFLKSTLKDLRAWKFSSFLDVGQDLYIKQQTIDFSALLGFKSIRVPTQGYEIGDLLLYSTDQKEVKRILKGMKYFREEQLAFSLQDFVDNAKIRLQNMQQFMRIFIRTEKDNISRLGLKYKFKIIKIQPYNKQQEQCIVLHVKGVIYNINQFYLALQQYVKSIKVKVLQVSQVKCCRVDQIYEKFNQYKLYLLDHKHLLIMDNNIDLYNIETQLRKGKWLINFEDFSREDLKVLYLEWQNKNYSQFLQTNGVYYDKIDITNDRIILQSNEFMYEKFKEKTKIFLEGFVKETKKISQFKDKFVIQIFLKHFEKLLKDKYAISFEYDNKSLIMKYFNKDIDEIKEDLKNIKNHILKQMTIIPSVEPVSQKEAYEKGLSGLYVQIDNPQHYQVEGVGAKRFIYNDELTIELMSICNWHKIQDTIIYFVIDDLCYKNEYSPIHQIIEENQLRFDKFLANATGRKSQRVAHYAISNSWLCKNLYLFYISMKDINYRHIQKDLEKLMKDVKDKDKICFVIPPTEKLFIDKVFIKVLQGVLQNQEAQNTDLQQLFIYYEDRRTILNLQQKMLRFQSERYKNTIQENRQLYLTEWDMKKLNGIPSYKLHYFKDEQSLNLGGLASFVFQMERFKGRNKKNRYFASLPTSTELTQYLVYLPQKIVYKIKNRNIVQVQLDQQQLLYIQVIKQYFKNLTYCIVHGVEKKGKINFHFDIYVIENHESQGYPLNYIKEKKKMNRTGKEPIHFHLTSEKYLQWFQIRTFKKDTQKVLKCLYSQK